MAAAHGARAGGAAARALPLLVDNQAALRMGQHSADTARAKHIDVTHHFLRQAVSREVVRLVYVNTDENVADLLTKALARVKFEKFRAMLGMS